MRPVYAAKGDRDAFGNTPGRFILGVVGFGVDRPAELDEECPFVRVELPVLGGGACYEVWTSASEVVWAHSGGVACAVSGDSLFGLLQPKPTDDADMAEAARDAYERLFTAASRHGCQHVLRVFNYLPRITAIEAGRERYHAFNSGRHEAFTAHGQALAAAPAACALGTHGKSAVIYFLASAQPGQAVENPRQVRAYHYPVRYGPRSPGFSRAMRAPGDTGSSLFISGTASIVGHESVHAGDVGAQTDETLRNLDAILAQCGGVRLRDMAATLMLKIYVRHVSDLATVKARLAGLPASVRIIYVQAEICRAELLVEIEAFCSV